MPGNLVMNGGTFMSGTITNYRLVGRVRYRQRPSVRNSGTIFANNVAPLQLGGSVINQAGGVVTANLGQISISGTFSNAGTFSAIGSVGTFGTWSTPAHGSRTRQRCIYQYVHGHYNGYVSMASGDVYVFTKRGHHGWQLREPEHQVQPV